jgi:hypothetical protein
MRDLLLQPNSYYLVNCNECLNCSDVFLFFVENVLVIAADLSRLLVREHVYEP